LFFILGLQLLAQPCREVIGYYPNWQWYDRNKLVAPSTIDYSQYTILNYSFFSPEANGTVQNTDAWADENLLLGEIDWSTTPPSYKPNTSLIDLAQGFMPDLL
jgi:GH18 family chitinase